MSLKGVFSLIFSHIFTMDLTKSSILGSKEGAEGETSSRYVTFLSDLVLALFSAKLASALMATFCISSKVGGVLVS